MTYHERFRPKRLRGIDRAQQRPTDLPDPTSFALGVAGEAAGRRCRDVGLGEAGPGAEVSQTRYGWPSETERRDDEDLQNRPSPRSHPPRITRRKQGVVPNS